MGKTKVINASKRNKFMQVHLQKTIGYALKLFMTFKSHHHLYNFHNLNILHENEHKHYCGLQSNDTL